MMEWDIYHTDVLIELSYWFQTLLYKIRSQNDEKKSLCTIREGGDIV